MTVDVATYGKRFTNHRPPTFQNIQFQSWFPTENNGFDHEKAIKDGKIIPSPGVDKEFDSAIDEIKRIEKLLDKYLVEQRKKFHAKSVRHVTDDYELQSQRKGFRRYWTSELKECLSEIMAAEDKRDAALKDIMRKIFEHYKEWLSAVECLSVLDDFQNSDPGSQDFLFQKVGASTALQPFIEIRNGCHPCVDASYSANEFIPNDVLIATKSKDGNSPSLVIVTGPNMGGESTFFVELNETSSILQHATKHSLVLMDELENENEEDPSQETITFLYKFAEGACPKSYGFNAAKLAGIPEITGRAFKSREAAIEKACAPECS
ncbi:DNA mismatch repair protein Msh6 [Nymphon striatum]|nr:DNA mismatch repair protein Msh6 [Nymphon striatum]